MAVDWDAFYTGVLPSISNARLAPSDAGYPTLDPTGARTGGPVKPAKPKVSSFADNFLSAVKRGGPANYVGDDGMWNITVAENDPEAPPETADAVASALGFGASEGDGVGTGSVDIFGFANDWLVRAAVIILGFIFVAVGLSMFKDNGVKVVLPTGP